MGTTCRVHMSSPLTLCEATELHEWIHHNDTVIIDAISSSSSPEFTIPTAICVRMDAFDIYRYEKSEKKRDEDDPSDSGRHAADSVTAPNLPIMSYGNFNLRPAAQLRTALESLGITMTTRVVVLTQNFKAGIADPITAARMAWLLCYCGVQDCRLLNGGFSAWQRCSYPVVPVTKVEDSTTLLDNNKEGEGEEEEEEDVAQKTGDAAPYISRRGRVDFLNGEKLTFPLRKDFLATSEEVMNIVKGRQCGVLADARSWDEYTGKMHGYNFDLGCGRIPGARWAHWGPSTYRGGDFSMPDAVGKLQDLQLIQTFWSEWNIIERREMEEEEEEEKEEKKKEKEEEEEEESRAIIFYCGSGWRSAMAWVVSQLLELKHCKSYDGSFLEWNKLHPNSSKHPIAQGIPKIVPSMVPSMIVSRNIGATE